GAGVRARDAVAGRAGVDRVVLDRAGRSALRPVDHGVHAVDAGNLPEFFVVIFALNAGQKIVAETAILGSILVNALLVLGLVIVAGSRRERDGVMRFSSGLPNDTATLLLVASFMIVLLGLAVGSHDPASHHTKTISIVGAVATLAAYVAWL